MGSPILGTTHIYIYIYPYIPTPFRGDGGASTAGLQSDPVLAHLNFAAVLSPLVPLVAMIADPQRLGIIPSSLWGYTMEETTWELR